MLSVNTNLSSLIAQNSLNSSTDALNLAIERMTTGYKINHAKDNAANYAIATQMSSQLSSYEVASNNVAMGMDLVMTADGIINNMQDKASRLHALCIQSRNGTYGAQSLNAINAEANALISEITRVYNTAEYNGISLFGGSTSPAPAMLMRAVSRAAVPATVSETSLADTLKPGENGFIDSAAVTSMPEAKYNGFIAEVVEETPDVVVTNPTDLKTAIQNNSKIGIANAETLAQLATLVNDEGINCSGKTIILTEDIDLSAYSNWRPIGYDYSHSFRGDFNGNGHIIKNLTINRPTEDYVGLFGFVNAKSLKNACFENINIKGKRYVGGLAGSIMNTNNITENCFVTGSVTGESYIGGLLGDQYGSTANSYTQCYILASGNYTGGLAGSANEISNSYATGDVTGQGDNTGGLAGYSSSISNSYATGDVTGQGSNTGGLAGEARAIINSYATVNVTGQGNYTGGLTGHASAITNSYATGSVTGNGKYTGGLVGTIEEIKNSYATGKVEGAGQYTGGLSGESMHIENSFAVGDVEGQDSYTGGLVGQAGYNITNSYASGNVSGTSFVGGLVGDANYLINPERNYSNSISYGTVSGTDANSTGSFIGGVYVDSSESEFKLNITDCQAKTQGMESIGGAYERGKTYSPTYDMTTMLAGITEAGPPPAPPVGPGGGSGGEVFTLQVGINSESTSQISFDTNFSFDLSALTADITSDESLDCILNFIDTLSSKSTELGAVSNRLESALESISVNIENLTSSRSTIKDADIAEVSSEYIRQQILQQASATLLSTANQSPSIALQLI